MKRDQRPHRRGLPAATENAGRVESYKRAKALGIDLRQEWVATLDGRTRRSHRQLDGEKVKVGEAFSNGCRFPGDPEAPYAETMNCRCTLVGAVDGFDTDDARRWSRLPEGMTYEQWKALGARPVTKHAAERMAERGVTQAQVDDALSSPLKTFPVEIRNGEPSMRMVGKEASVVVNPQTGAIITTYRTKSRYRRKYGREANESERSTGQTA